jgi:DNA-binding GntR family transcriptional regulator
VSPWVECGVRNDQTPDNHGRPAAAPPTPLEVPSLVDALYEDLRERILSGVLPAGTAVTEMDLAAQYSVARPTAKASMERLVHDGLLRRGSHKTARVPLLGTDDILDLYRTRSYLEREVTIVLTEKQLVPDAARRSVQQMYDMGADPPLMGVVNIDVAFHSALVDALGSPRMNRLFRSLVAEVRLSMAQVQAHHLLQPLRIADEHSAILDRIEHGDVEGAVTEITAHLERACARLISHVESIAATSK